MNTSWKSVSPDVVRGFCGAQLAEEHERDKKHPDRIELPG
jgi:hypothetical protein